MSNFDRAFAIVVGIEGALSLDPDDPGNWTGGKVGAGALKGTKFGIAAATHPDLDIANLSLDQAKALYRAEHWDKGNCDSLPWPVNLLLFEAGVNVGAGTAAKLLQQALRLPPEQVDGIVGPGTARAIGLADRAELVARFQAKLGVRYAKLPGAPDNLEGWLYREFRAEWDALTSPA